MQAAGLSGMLALAACGGAGDQGTGSTPAPSPGPSQTPEPTPIATSTPTPAATSTANQTPTAAAGADQTVSAGATVILAGSGGDQDGSIVSYAWTQIAGPTVLLSGSDSMSASFTAPQTSGSQALVFRLTVTDDDGATAIDEVTVTTQPVVLRTLILSRTELAQTHLLPPDGKRWTSRNGDARLRELHMVAGREALLLTEVTPADLQDFRIEGRVGARLLGDVLLDDNTALPATEAAGVRYSGTVRVARLPEAWLQPGLQLRATALTAQPSAWFDVNVGADNDFTVRILPFYLFGADESDVSLVEAGTPPADAIEEMYAKWPVAKLDVAPHPAGKVAWDRLVISPRADGNGVARSAYIADDADDYQDGFAGLSTLHRVVRALMAANGEDVLPVQYYAPLVALDASGEAVSAGGGIGGGSVGTGDTSYRGIFIHEQGHAFGLPHAGSSFDNGDYPYQWGSLEGSAWGYDGGRDEFLPPQIPATASTYNGCHEDSFAGHPRAVDDSGQCIKQDPMQSGSGDQDSGYRYATFADYSTAVMQSWFEGTTTLAGDGSHEYSGRLVRDAGFASGYRRWDGIDKTWVNADRSTTSYGLYGFDAGTPIQNNVPVYSIVVTMSYAGTSGATQIYPPIRYTGNLLRQIDPTNADDRASIDVSTGAYDWFCEYNGCDYTVRVRYSNGTVRHVLLQDCFRNWFGADEAIPASASDPVDGDSFRLWAVNVPADANLAGIDLLSTPRAWEGMPLLPTVLATR